MLRRLGAGALLTLAISCGLYTGTHIRSGTKPNGAAYDAQTTSRYGDNTISELRSKLLHAYTADSVKLTRANSTGHIPLLSSHAPDREIVTTHIDYRVNGESAKTKGVTYDTGGSIPPLETVVGPGNSTKPGVINWDTNPPNGDVDMQVALEPFAGSKAVTREYRLYLSAVSLNGDNGKPIASEFYAGTVDITGHNYLISNVKIDHEDNITAEQLVYPSSPSVLYGPSNDSNAG